MTNDFYRSFEDKYRGSRTLIKQRLEAYIPFIQPLSKIYDETCTVDIGCGRGEWLELLTDLGFSPSGVDSDEGMLAACKDLGLNAEHGDALEYLRVIDDNSQVIVSGFHIVEHVDFETVLQWSKEALRVLKPGGVLIFETPNPENISVSTNSFYLDPSHIKPVPSQLLTFALDYIGFARVKTVRLQEPEQDGNTTVKDLIYSVSPDYGVVAQKHATEAILKSFDSAFDVEYGVSLNELVSKLDARFDQAEVKATQAEVKATQAEAKATQAEVKATQAEVKATQAEAAFMQIYASKSWRLTRCLRFFDAQLRKLRKN